MPTIALKAKSQDSVFTTLCLEGSLGLLLMKHSKLHSHLGKRRMYMIMYIILGKDYNGLTILLKTILTKMWPDVNFTMIGNIIAWK